MTLNIMPDGEGNSVHDYQCMWPFVTVHMSWRLFLSVHMIPETKEISLKIVCPHCFKDIRSYLDSVFENPEYIGTKIEIVETLFWKDIMIQKWKFKCTCGKRLGNLFNSNNAMFECLS